VIFSMLSKLAHQAGFTTVGELDTAGLRFSPEVRAMCAADRCGKYNKSWSCPPACGTPEEIAQKAARYSRGLLVQTTGIMADDFDWEAIRQVEQLHKKQFDTLVRQVKYLVPHCLPMGCGVCTRCRRCTYPDKPCRFPGKVYPSMEACGLLVSEVCQLAGVPYYYGSRTITYTSCILMNERENDHGNCKRTL